MTDPVVLFHAGVPYPDKLKNFFPQHFFPSEEDASLVCFFSAQPRCKFIHPPA